jgi:uncharacterized protein
MKSMNPIVHFEIPVKDPKRAKAFYEDMFGWDIKQWGSMDYWMATTTEADKLGRPAKPGAINGALYKTAGKEAPVLVIAVQSIDDHVKMITKAGGSLVAKKAKVGEMGYYAKVTDSEGNVIGLWQMA